MTQAPTQTSTTLPCVFDWLREHEDGRPWLVCGTGPSFDRYQTEKIDFARYRVCAINETVRYVPLGRHDLAHVTDIENFSRSAGYYGVVSCAVVCPWHLHVAKQPGVTMLAEWCGMQSISQAASGEWFEQIPLELLRSKGQLFWYDSSKAKRRAPHGPVVEVHYGSGEAAIHVLAIAGVKTIRTLGIDGTADHSVLFDKAMRARDPLNYRAETLAINRIVETFHLDYAPL